MAEKIIIFMCAVLCAVPFFLIGYLNRNSDEPITFFSGDTTLKNRIGDIKAYNAAMGRMYCIYALVVLVTGLISFFNIVNSISMSVSARTKQYGVMRAIGMDGSQFTRMVAAEAFTYAASGLIVGCIAGLLLSRMLYARLITRYFGMTWHLPGMTLCLIILFVFAAAALAVHAPAKRIRNMAITETINEL